MKTLKLYSIQYRKQFSLTLALNIEMIRYSKLIFNYSKKSLNITFLKGKACFISKRDALNTEIKKLSNTSKNRLHM